MSEYTPTTEEIRFAYVDRKDFEAQVAHLERTGDEFSGAEFDRWYEAEKRKWQAEALREYADGLDQARKSIGGMDAEWIALSMRVKADQIEQEASDDRADA